MKKKFVAWIAAIAMLAVTILPEVPVYASQPEDIISLGEDDIDCLSGTEIPEETAMPETYVEQEESVLPDVSFAESDLAEGLSEEIIDEDATDELLNAPDGVSLQFIDELGNVAGTEDSRSKRLRIPFCLTDSTKTGVFTIKNLSDGPVTISSVEGESYSTFEIADPELNPGDDTTCTVTYNHDASANSTESPNLTVNLISGVESYSTTLYAMYVFGYRGEYRPQELPTGEIRLVGDTTVVLEDGDEFDRGKYMKNVYLTRTYADAGMNFPITLTFAGSDDGKLATAIGYETTLDTLKIEGGDICLTDSIGSSSHSSWLNKLIMTGGKLGINNTYFSARIKSVEISGGECDFSGSLDVYVQDSFTISGGKFIGNKLRRNNNDNGGQIIPEAVISGTGEVEITGKTSSDYMAVKDLTVSDSAMITAVSNATTPLEIRGTLTLGDDVKVLLPAGGRYDPTSKRFKDAENQDYYGTVKIGPEPSVTPENPSFTINMTDIDCGTYVKGSYVDWDPGAYVKEVTVTNTGDSELLFSPLRPSNFIFGGYSKVKLAPGETMTFKIWPKEKTTAKKYEETFTIKTDAGVSKTFKASFTVEDPRYSLAFSPTAVEFPLLYLGSSPTSQEVTVTNDGNVPCTLTEASATNFTANVTEWPKLAVNETYTFTVQPKPGLAVGPYSENMVFAISEDAATYTLPLSVEVKKSNAKAAFTAVSSENVSFSGAIDDEDSAKATADFGTVIKGYDFTGGSPLNIEITNTGEESIQFNNVTSEKYTLTYSRTPASLGTGVTTSKIMLSILPKGGLTAGSHNETVTLTTVQGFTMNIELKFAVEEATVSLEYTDVFGNVAGTGSERSKRLRIPFCLTDDTKTSGFTVKNTGNVPITISSIAGGTNSTFAFTDSTLDPGEETTCTVTYTGNAYVNGSSEPELTVNIESGGNTYTKTIYAYYFFGFRGEYEAQEFYDDGTLLTNIPLIGDTTIVLDDTDDLNMAGKFMKNVYLTDTYIDGNCPITLTFKGSDNGKLKTTISSDTTLDTLKIEGGDICLKGDLGGPSSSSFVDKLVMTGGKLGTDAISFSAKLKAIDISGGTCDLSDSWAVYVQDSFKVSGGKFIGNKLCRNNDDNGGQIIPEAVISGTGRVEIIGKANNDNMYVKDLTVSDNATLAAAGAYSPLLITGSLTLGDDIKVLLPAGGRFDASEKRFKDSAGQDYYGPVKIGPEPTVVTNPAFTIEPEVVTAASFVEGQYPDPFPEGDKAIVTVTNTGDTELTFASFASEKFAVSAYSKSKLEPGETMTFKIWPKNIEGAVAGSYSEDLTISTNAGISRTFKAKYEITAAPEPVYGLTATPASIDFGEKLVNELGGASGFKAVTVTLTNTGNQAQTIASVTQNVGHKFIIYDGVPEEGDEIAAGETKSFKVIPSADFNASGTSDLSLTITTEHGETVTITAHASITDIAAGQLIVKRLPD
ncbi:MAG: choice-of-anchor D domain-containing protein, partial [Lachnospiraceae bacterium]|nr:choice-of-anchor D domain-containing protein [Lachnospiraceae bacterium]